MKEKKDVIDYILLGVGIVSCIVFVVAGGFLLRYYLDYRNQAGKDEEVAKLHDVLIAASDENSNVADDGADRSEADYKALHDAFIRDMKAANADYVGFINVPDTHIYYPIVQKDNDYYLKHNFQGEANRHGAIFMDESCKPEDDVLLIHGHHMKDGTMFGDLKKFKKKDFIAEHETFYIDFGDGDKEYRIFAVCLIDLTDENSFKYEILPEQEPEAVAKYIKSFCKASFWANSTDVVDKQVVLLSTCDYGTEEQRLVVAAVCAE